MPSLFADGENEMRMTPEFEEFLSALARNSHAPGASDLALMWAAAGIVLRNPDAKDRFTWISWASPSESLPDARAMFGPIERYPWAVHASDTAPYWAVGVAGRNAWYWGDLVQQVQRLHYLYRSKLRALVDECERAIPESKLLVSVLLMRSLLENAATVYATGMLLKASLAGFDLSELEKTEVTNDELKRKLAGRFSGTRFNWNALAAGDFDAFLAKPELGRKDLKNAAQFPQIMDDIDCVERNPDYSAFRLAYSWMCEYVHPNVGSHLLFLKRAAAFRGRIVAGYDTTATRDETVLFLEPFAAALCTCMDIIVVVLPQLVSFVAPIGRWCDSTESRLLSTSEPPPEMGG
jgi:hypothetical protein